MNNVIKENDFIKIIIPPNTTETHKIIIPNADHYDVIVVVQENSKLSLDLDLKDVTNSNLTFTFELERNASLKEDLISIENEGNIKIEQNVTLLANASFTGVTFDTSKGNIEVDNNVYLKEENANSYIRNAVVSDSDSKKKFTINTVNEVFSTSSLMDNYGVAKESATLDFIGIGKVVKGAHGSTNKQNSKIIVFDETSKANISPYLFIDEYDVVASHAAAVGKVNEDHLYYMTSRGLTPETARQYITLGYLLPVLNYFEDEAVKSRITSMLERRVNHV
jgi:Fe-S cluster assembly protein SufD